MTEKLSELINDSKIKIDNYNNTLEVIKIFGHEMCCDPGEIEPKDGAKLNCINNYKISVYALRLNDIELGNLFLL
jgi:hypothetical protein